jgi:predicted ester cyclase
MKQLKWILFWVALGTLFNADAGSLPTKTACAPGVQERSKAIARTVFEEILSRGRVDENERLYHPSFVAHTPLRDAYRDEDREASKGWRKAVPNLRMDVLRIVAECNLVVVHWTCSGTNSGEGNGLPATGKTLANLWGMTIFRIQAGQIREEWTSFDQYAMLKQLGLLPGDTQPAASR